MRIARLSFDARRQENYNVQGRNKKHFESGLARARELTERGTGWRTAVWSLSESRCPLNK